MRDVNTFGISSDDELSMQSRCLPILYANNVTFDFSRPRKPTDNGFIEAFNRLRSECLNAHWFLSLADSREKLETWRRYDNEERPHSAIGYNVTIAPHNPCVATIVRRPPGQEAEHRSPRSRSSGYRARGSFRRGC